MAINVTLRQDQRELALLERIAVALETIALELKPETDPDDATRIAAATEGIQASTAALQAAIPPKE